MVSRTSESGGELVPVTRSVVADSPEMRDWAEQLVARARSEGVELTDQSNFLKRFSCDQMQGYLIKPPVPASEFLDLISLAARDAVS